MRIGTDGRPETNQERGDLGGVAMDASLSAMRHERPKLCSKGPRALRRNMGRTMAAGVKRESNGRLILSLYLSILSLMASNGELERVDV